MLVPASNVSPSLVIVLPQDDAACNTVCFFCRFAQLYDCIMLITLSNWLPPLDGTNMYTAVYQLLCVFIEHTASRPL